MLSAIGDFILGVSFFTAFLMFMTFPAWLAGLIVAWRTRTLPVPFFYRLKLIRWASWYLTGIIGMVAAVLATRPAGSFEMSTRVAFVGVVIVAYLLTAVAAFYISWTASAKRRSRKQGGDASDSLPMAQGLNAEDATVLPAREQEVGEYAPASPNQPHTGGAPTGGPKEYPPAQPES